jgi:hypothetical protein
MDVSPAESASQGIGISGLAIGWAYEEARYGQRKVIINDPDWDGPKFQTCVNASNVSKKFSLEVIASGYFLPLSTMRKLPRSIFPKPTRFSIGARRHRAFGRGFIGRFGSNSNCDLGLSVALGNRQGASAPCPLRSFGQPPAKDRRAAPTECHRQSRATQRKTRYRQP